MKFVKGCLVALLGLWVVIGVSPGSAQAVFSDTIIIITDGNSTPPTGVSFDETNEGTPFIFDTGIGGNSFGGPNAIIGEVILDEPVTGAFSDLIRAFVNANGSVAIFFCSDVEGGPQCAQPSSTNPTHITETGSLQDIRSQLGLGQSGVFALQVQSDVEQTAVTAVPEPGTLLMLGVGLAGLASAARVGRKRDK